MGTVKAAALALLAGLLLPADGAASNSVPDNEAVLPALETCIEQQKPPDDAQPWQALVDVRRLCPQVHAWLTSARNSGFLSTGNVNAPGHRMLVSLHGFLTNQADRSKAGDMLTRPALDLIISELDLTAAGELSLWQEFLNWFWSTSAADDENLRWIEQLAEFLESWKPFIDVMFDVTLVLLVLAAIVLVSNELRLFGWRSRSPGQRTVRNGARSSPGPGNVEETWASISERSPRGQIAGALQLLLTSLPIDADTRRRRMSLTNREFLTLTSASSRAPDDQYLDSLRTLLGRIDQALYGETSPGPDLASSILNACQQLSRNVSPASDGTTAR